MSFFELLLHLDEYLLMAVNTYNSYFYVLLFIVIFCETGLVVTPFLPGDSLLFLIGGLAAIGKLHLIGISAIVIAAAFLGDNCNFFIGRFLGEKLFRNPKSKIFRQDILKRTHDFYAHYGKKTVIIARFAPLVRTFSPFVAGIGAMKYASFISYSIIGSILWVSVLLGGGYLFGNLAFVKSHLSVIIIAIVIVSLLPLITMLYNELKSWSK